MHDSAHVEFRCYDNDEHFIGVTIQGYTGYLSLGFQLILNIPTLTFNCPTPISCFFALLTLDISLSFVKGNIALDLVHAVQWLWIVPRCVFDFRLVGCDGVVACVSLVRAMCFCVRGAEVVAFDGVGWKLSMLGDRQR
jgi:hypothetical protein